MSKEPRFCKREFLNGPGFHSLAAIMIQFDDNRDTDYSDRFYTEFSITDCSRSVNLELDVDTMEGLDNSVNKLLTIVKICDEAAQELKKMRPELEVYLKEEEEKDKLKKEKKKVENLKVEDFRIL